MILLFTLTYLLLYILIWALKNEHILVCPITDTLYLSCSIYSFFFIVKYFSYNIIVNYLYWGIRIQDSSPFLYFFFLKCYALLHKLGMMSQSICI